MKLNFPPALKFTLGFEGGYVNHPKDPGGHTNKGITLSTLRRYRPGATVADLKAIPDDLVERIYKDGYWDKVNGDTLAAGVDGATFDYAVNSGPAAAKKSLMASIGGTPVETVKRLCARRLSIYKTFRHWSTFGKGWTRRIVTGEALWVKWALAASTAPERVPVEMAKEEATARTQSGKDAVKAGGSGAGAGGAGVSTTVDSGVQWDQMVHLFAGGLVVLGIAAAIYFIWRAHVNKLRAEAYRKEAVAA